MNQATPPPSYFREISNKLFDDLLNLLCQGRHLALISPRQSGKALVLYELRQRSKLLPDADRPDVIVLRSLDFRGDSRAGFAEQLASHLGIEEFGVVDCAGQSLAAGVLELLRCAVSRHRTPLWLFVQNITELAWPFARALLTALQSAFEDLEFRGRFAVVITGGRDFVPLTYNANSPYRHAEKFFLQGLDREMTRRFFRARIAGVSLYEGFAEISTDATPPIDEDALDFLFEQTGGYARFIEEIVLTKGRLTPLIELNHHSRPWTREYVQELIERFLKEYMRFDQYCRLALRDVERNADAWTKLEQLANNPASGVHISEVQPHLLETSGIACRKNGTTLVFASPMWERFLRTILDQQHRADNYARLGEWDLAWNLYTGLNAADCDRPLDGDERYRLDSVIDAWEDYLVEITTRGASEVVKHFMLGARHLYGCDAGILFDQTSHRVIQELATNQPSQTGLFVDDAINFIADEAIDIRLTPTGDAIESAPKANRLHEQSELDLVLQLRRGPEREIDAAALNRLRRSLRRFWLAYLTAERVEHAGLRERHLQVVAKVNDLLSHYPGDMGKVVEGTVDALIDIAGYYRILICLVSPRGDRIQAVAGRCADRTLEFNYRTDFPLERDSPERDWDIQQWVAIKGETVAVDDASSEKHHSPRTNSQYVVTIGMKGIAVVPMKVVRSAENFEEILGTIHFERQDKRRPTEVELRSFEILAGQIAVAFDHARRQTMLEQALNALKNEFRIVSPDRRIVFENCAAAEVDGHQSFLWQDPNPNHSDQAGGQRFDRDVIDDAARKQAGVHRYVTTSTDPQRAFDDFAAPISDWRTQLDGVFQSDGMLGFVYQSFELSDFMRIHEASQQWLSLTSPRETAQRILDYFRKQKFKWCRIYLFENDDQLVSFEEFGISDQAVRQDFLDGKFVVVRGDRGQQVFFLLDEFPDLAVLRFDANISGSPILDNEFGRGVPTFRSKDNWRPDFGKTDERWLEAPLIVGDQKIGLIALEMPPAFSPQSYQMLRWCVMSVAVALHNALDAERAIRHRFEVAGAKEEAWQSAAQLAIHQLANKLSPVESECNYVQSWLRSHSLEATSGYGDVNDALSNSQKSIAFARGILMDFRRYASDEPFK
ncbi:MAG: GAF domain-containing protein, partial [Planctomycetaceae bacterium]|nr:GAF domain-containing protein [Planctomycetaceae bacterium]